MASKPNILVITTHDTGRHFGCYGVDTVHTPCIDRLADDGVRFTDYFATSTLCSPSRGAMLTGRYPQSNGLMGLTHSPWHWSYKDGERHLSHILRDEGFHTALFGLQHEASDVHTLGFQTQEGGPRPEGGRPPCDEVAGMVARFLEGGAAERQPFYAQVGFFETHRPFDFGGVEPDDSLGVTVPPYLVPNEEVRDDLAHFQGAIRKADSAVGTVVDALESSGLAEDTILVYTVDHGIPFPRAKTFLYDPGISVALIVRWPGGGISGGRTSDRLTSNVDFLPTVLELANVPVPETVQGESFAGAFGRPDSVPARDAVFATMHGHGGANEMRCVRTDRYKLIRNFVPRRRLEVPVDVTGPAPKVKCPVAQLFDLKNDPNEFNEVTDRPEYADVYRDLSARLWDWMEEAGDPLLQGPIRTPYYDEAMWEYTRPT